MADVSVNNGSRRSRGRIRDSRSVRRLCHRCGGIIGNHASRSADAYTPSCATAARRIRETETLKTRDYEGAVKLGAKSGTKDGEREVAFLSPTSAGNKSPAKNLAVTGTTNRSSSEPKLKVSLHMERTRAREGGGRHGGVVIKRRLATFHLLESSVCPDQLVESHET